MFHFLQHLFNHSVDLWIKKDVDFIIQCDIFVFHLNLRLLVAAITPGRPQDEASTFLFLSKQQSSNCLIMNWNKSVLNALWFVTVMLCCVAFVLRWSSLLE